MAAIPPTSYLIDLSCDYSEWWRYNVYIMAAGFSEEGGPATLDNLVDKVADTGSQLRDAPPGYPTPRTIRLETRPCIFVDIYIYVVANSFPATDSVGDWPPFPVTLRVGVGGKTVEEKTWDVNQWGGLTVVAYRADIDGHDPGSVGPALPQ